MPAIAPFDSRPPCAPPFSQSRTRLLRRNARRSPGAAADHRRCAHPLQPGRLVDAAARRGHQGAEAGRAEEGVRLQLQRRRHADALQGGAGPDRAGAAPLSHARRDGHVDAATRASSPTWRRGSRPTPTPASASSTPTARTPTLPVMRRMVRARQGAQDLPARALRRRRGRAHVQAGPGGAGAVGALGLRPVEQGARHGGQAQDAVGRRRPPQRPRAVGQARRARGSSCSSTSPSASWWAPTPTTPERWHYVVEHASYSRKWLAELPAELADNIAFRNAERLAARTLGQ